MPSATTNRRARLGTLLLGIAIVVSGLFAGGIPAQAASTYSVSGTVYLGSTPAGAGEVLVRWGIDKDHLPAAGVLTDAAGQFVLTGLLDGGWYYLYYDYQGTEAYPDVYHPGVVNGGSATQVMIAGADITDVVGTIPAPGPIAGTITQLANGAPYGDVEITAYRYTESFVYTQVGSVLANADGTYSVPNLPAGTYKLRFRNLGTAPVQSGYYGGSGFQWTASYLNFGGAADTTPRNMAMTPVQSIGGTVNLGTVGNVAGDSEVFVSARYRDEDHGGYVVSPEVPTSSTGTYLVPNLVIAASYTLVFRFAGTGLVGYYSTTATNLLMGTSALTTKNITLTRAHTIAGTVQLGVGGPMAGAGDVTVTMHSANPPDTIVTTDASGAFVANVLNYGVYTVKFHYNGVGYPDVTLPSTVTVPPDATGLSVVMPRGGIISGRAQLASYPGMHVSTGVRVIAHRLDPDTRIELGQYSAVTNYYGLYSFAPVADGLYWVEFTQPGYAQTWGDRGPYGEPDYFEVSNADVHTDTDGFLYYVGEIKGSINAPGIDDFDPEAFTVTALVKVGGVWVDSGNVAEVGGYRTYSFQTLPPADYRLRFAYDGTLGHSEVTSPTITVTEAASIRYNADVASPEAPLPVGTLVTFGTTPTIFLVDGADRIVPVENLAAAADAGVSATVQNVRAFRIMGRTGSDDALRNVIRCGDGPGNTYLAAGGGLVPLSDDLAGDWTATSLTGETCAALPHRAVPTVTGALYAGAPGKQVFRIGADEVGRPVLDVTNTGALIVNRYPVYSVNEHALDTQGSQAGLPGALYKSSASPIVYFSDGDRLVPLRSLATISDLGLSTKVKSIPPSFLAAFNISADPLVNVIDCDGAYYIGSGGMRQPVSPAVVAGLHSTALNADTCGSIPSTGPAPAHVVPPLISRALFLKSSSSPTNYYINPVGEKQVATSAQSRLLSAPAAPRYLTVNSSYLASIPTGGPLVVAGSVVKGPTGSAVYLVADDSHLVPLRVTSLPDFGLAATSPALSAVRFSGMAVDAQPLGNAVSCDAVEYVASGGKLWLITPGAAGPVTELPESLCATMPRGSSSATPLYLRSPSGKTAYHVTDGTKSPDAITSLFVRSAPGRLVLTVNALYLDGLPTSCGPAGGLFVAGACRVVMPTVPPRVTSPSWAFALH